MKTSLLFSFLLLSSFAGAQHQTWKGTWITNTEDIHQQGAPLFRKTFTVSKPVTSALLSICGVGYQISQLNGSPVTKAVLEQAFTRYDRRLLYQTYEVNKLLKPGNNCIGIELGNGWYNVQSHTIWNFDKIGWRKTPRLLCNLVLCYTDGTRDTICSDTSWKVSTGPDRFNSLQAGEIYDARKEIPGWNKADFNDFQWASAQETSTPGGVLEPQEMPSIHVIKQIKPISVKKTGKQWLFDMGENFAGVVTLRVKGRAGDTIKLIYDELLNIDGSLNTAQNAGQMIGGPAEPKFQTDVYILKGGGVETFTPRFTYHGFQYVQVSAPATIQLDKSAITGLFYSTHFKAAGTFTSSDPMLNKLYQAAIQSYRSNYVGNPTDCPQREKMGWLADAHFGAELGIWNFEAAAGYKTYLKNLRDVQLPDGQLPGVAPTNGIGYHWIDPADDDFGPIWGSALPIITGYLYTYTGDSTIIQENYAAIKRYVDYLATRAANTGNIYTTGLADWQALAETPKAMTSTALLYHDLLLLTHMAKTLSKPADEIHYRELAIQVKAAYNTHFYDRKNHTYQPHTMTALGMALYYHLCPEGEEQQLADKLAQALTNRNYAVDFGILGTKTILSALADYGYETIAYRLLTNTNTGWAKWMTTGSTTLWEEWPGTTSHNHVYSGDYVNWYFRYLGGIRPDDTHPGFTHFSIKPVFPQGVSWVKVSHETKYGKIVCHWEVKSGKITMKVEIPPNTTATVYVPTIDGKSYNKHEVGSGRYKF